jgi:predicted transcriptional regulator
MGTQCHMDEKDISVGVTAFIDILGFANKVLAAKNIDDIKEIHKGIKLIQDAFHFATDDDLTRKVQEMHKTTVLAFSDCVVFNIPLESDATKYEGTFDPIMSEITSFAYGQGICCLNSLFIRGGLDLGWWYQKDATLISQSMVNAYISESAVSVPVIALTDRIYDYFSKHSHRKYYSDDFDPIPRVFRVLKINGKEHRYIDYMTICLEGVGWQRSKEQLDKYRLSSPEDKDKIMNEGYRHNIDEWLKTHSENIKRAHASTNEVSVRAKYEWLSNYHNEIANNFTHNQDCQCTI